ncbi:MAG: hypothetical protein IJR68_04715 [Fretibacterium sp.]|nr:hypothetical protein [Fretibacterium sp.]
MEKIKKAVLADIQRANAFFGEKVEPVLRIRHQLYEADKDYYRKRFPRISQESDFVSYDFWSMVQWAIPAVMNSFFGGDEAVVIVGRSGEDMPQAEKIKALIDFQIMTQNKGFLLLWDWFSDAFQYNLGAVKVWWKREEEWGADTLEYVDELTVMQLQQDPWIQVVSIQGPDPLGQFAVMYRTGRLKENRPVIESVRVTDLRWSPEARSLEEANFVAQRKIVTADHLRRQARAGVYDPDAVERALEKEAGSHVIWTSLDTELNDQLDSRREDEDPARALHELYECYVKLDINGDGLLEDALVTVVGEELLRVEENPWGRTPIFALSPVRDPFRVMANQSFAEIVGEIQSLKVALIRQFIINTANVNNLRHFVDQTLVNVTDLEDNRQFIRTTGDPRGIAMPFPQGTIAPWTLNFFEYLEGALEQWTGRTRYNQGTDSASLNKTATGISLLQQASEQRIDYIVRVFAETGVGEMMRFLVELDQRYIDQAQVIRLQNEPIEISPDDLSGEFDIDVNTEAGVGKRKQTIQNLQFYLSAIAPFGMQVGAVTPGEWAKAAQKLLLESGIRDPESYVLDPEIVKQQFFVQMMTAMMAEEGAERGAIDGAGAAAGDAAARGGAGPQMGNGGGGPGGVL